tara:strand:- start:2209 stop:2448 length:240 start_codon:yes stop_codon:yes gene_type:complete
MRSPLSTKALITATITLLVNVAAGTWAALQRPIVSTNGVFGTSGADGNPEELFVTKIHPFIWVTILYIAQFVSIYFLFY